MKARAALVAWTAALLVTGLAPCRADFPDGFNHAGTAWREFQTDHFTVIYDQGLEPAARTAARLLEQVRGPIHDHLGVDTPARATVILADYDDVGANNFAKRMQHVIYLSNPLINQARVGHEAWLTHLLAHEYTHVANGYALRDSQEQLGTWIEWSGMEYQPQWFTEGLAEYEANARAKNPVSFALLAAKQDQLLYGGQLDVADTRFNVLQTAVMYQQGHAFCVELAQRFGDDIFKKVLAEMGTAPQFDIAFKLATGTTLEDFVRVATKHLVAAAAKLPGTEALDATSRVIPTGLEAALGGRLSPDGRHLAYYGVDDWEEPIPALYLARPDGSGAVKLAGNLDLYSSWKLTWSADSKQLGFVGRVRDRSGAVRNALFVHELPSHRTRRIEPAGDVSLYEPEFSPDGRRFAFVTKGGEHAALAVMDVDGSHVRIVSGGVPGDCFSPTWSPDGNRLAFSLSDAEGTDIALMALDGSGFRRLTHDVWPDQYPAWSPDGRTLAFVSYRKAGESGDRSAAVAAEAEGLSAAATNIYSLAVDGGPLNQLTRATTGGVFYPAWTADSQSLLVSLFKVKTADLRVISAKPLAVAELPAPTVTAQAAPEPTLGTKSRDYHAARHLSTFLARPFNSDDALGTQWGARLRATDPLAQHTVVVAGTYGYKSEKPGYEVSYVNDQTNWRLGVEASRKVAPLRAESGTLVAETTEGAAFLAQRPLACARNAYIKDKFSFGFEAADHHPFLTVGGAGSATPRRTLVVAPSVAFERTALMPGHGQRQFQLKVTHADKAVGSDIGYTDTSASYNVRLWAPTPRHVLELGAMTDWFTGQDFTRAETHQVIGAGNVKWSSRLWDQAFSRYTWPYVHLGPMYFNAAYQKRFMVAGQSGGADLLDRFSTQFVSTGYLTRHATYSLTGGQTTYINHGHNDVDWALQVGIHLRELPY